MQENASPSPLERLERLATSVQAARSDLRDKGRDLDLAAFSDRVRILDGARETARELRSMLPDVVGEERDRADRAEADVAEIALWGQTELARKEVWATRVEPHIQLIRAAANEASSTHAELRAKRRELTGEVVGAMRERLTHLHREALEAHQLLSSEDIPRSVRERMGGALGALTRAMEDATRTFETKHQWETGQAANAAAVEALVVELEQAARDGANANELRDGVRRVMREIDRRRPLSRKAREGFEARAQAVGAEVSAELASEREARRQREKLVRGRLGALFGELEALLGAEWMTPPAEEKPAKRRGKGKGSQGAEPPPAAAGAASDAPETSGDVPLDSERDAQAQPSAERGPEGAAPLEAADSAGLGGDVASDADEALDSDLPDAGADDLGSEGAGEGDEPFQGDGEGADTGDDSQDVGADTDGDDDSQDDGSDTYGDPAEGDDFEAHGDDAEGDSGGGVDEAAHEEGEAGDAAEAAPGAEAAEGGRRGKRRRRGKRDAEAGQAPAEAPAAETAGPVFPKLDPKQAEQVLRLDRELQQISTDPVIGWGERRRLRGLLDASRRGAQMARRQLQSARLDHWRADVDDAVNRAKAGPVVGVLRQIQSLQKNLKDSGLSPRQQAGLRDQLREAWTVATARIESEKQVKQQQREGQLRSLATHFGRWQSRVDGLSGLIGRLEDDLEYRTTTGANSTSIGYRVLVEQFRVKTEARLKELRETRAELLQKISDVKPRLEASGWPWPDDHDPDAGDTSEGEPGNGA